MKPKHKINVRSVIAHIVLILLSVFMPVLLCNTYNQCDKVACTAAERASHLSRAGISWII